MKPTASARVPERARLAATIERHAEAAEQLARVEQAIQRIQDDRINDRTAIARAHEALKIANAGRSEIIIASALNEPVPDLPSPAAAKTMLDECEARLDASTSALRVLDGEQRQAKFSADLAKTALDDALKAAVEADPAAARLRGEFARSMATAARLWRALRTAGVLGVVNIVERLGGEDPDWISALAALRGNPDAPLPDLPPDAPLDHARAGGHKRAAA